MTNSKVLRALGLALAVAIVSASTGHAQTVQPAAPGTVRALYNPTNGNVQVAINAVGTWYLESLTNFTGSAPTLPDVAGSLKTDNDNRVGQSLFAGTMTYTQDLGNVAKLGLTLADFAMKSSVGLGSPEINGIVDIVAIPEPASIAMLSGAALVVAGYNRRRRSA